MKVCVLLTRLQLDIYIISSCLKSIKGKEMKLLVHVLHFINNQIQKMTLASKYIYFLLLCLTQSNKMKKNSFFLLYVNVCVWIVNLCRKF